MNWLSRLRKHFNGREELTIDNLAIEFRALDKDSRDALEHVTALIQSEYGIPSGLLRPSDSLKLFTDAEMPRNPLRWLFDRAAMEDRATELHYRLALQREKTGRPNVPTPPATLQDYVKAWSRASG
jgi:hypothetical protein